MRVAMLVRRAMPDDAAAIATIEVTSWQAAYQWTNDDRRLRRRGASGAVLSAGGRMSERKSYQLRSSSSRSDAIV
jgi:hypothetical protein